MLYANNKGADQHAHPCSQISAFVVRCLDSIIPLLAIAETVPIAEKAGLSLTWSQTPKTGFSRDAAHLCTEWLNYFSSKMCDISNQPAPSAQSDQSRHCPLWDSGTSERQEKISCGCISQIELISFLDFIMPS